MLALLEGGADIHQADTLNGLELSRIGNNGLMTGGAQTALTQASGMGNEGLVHLLAAWGAQSDHLRNRVAVAAGIKMTGIIGVEDRERATRVLNFTADTTPHVWGDGQSGFESEYTWSKMKHAKMATVRAKCKEAIGGMKVAGPESFLSMATIEKRCARLMAYPKPAKAGGGGRKKRKQSRWTRYTNSDEGKRLREFYYHVSGRTSLLPPPEGPSHTVELSLARFDDYFGPLIWPRLALAAGERECPTFDAMVQETHEAHLENRQAVTVPADPDIAWLTEEGFTVAEAKVGLAEHPGDARSALRWLQERSDRGHDARQAQQQTSQIRPDVRGQQEKSSAGGARLIPGAIRPIEEGDDELPAAFVATDEL